MSAKEKQPITIYSCALVKDGFEIKYGKKFFGSVYTKGWEEEVGTKRFKLRMKEEAAKFLKGKYLILFQPNESYNYINVDSKEK